MINQQAELCAYTANKDKLKLILLHHHWEDNSCILYQTSASFLKSSISSALSAILCEKITIKLCRAIKEKIKIPADPLRLELIYSMTKTKLIVHNFLLNKDNNPYHLYNE